MTAFMIQHYYLQKRQYTTVTGTSSKLVSRGACRVLYGVVMLFALMIFLFYGTILVGAFTTVWGVNFTPTLKHFIYAFSVGFDTIKDTLIVHVDFGHFGYADRLPGRPAHLSG